MIILGLQDTLEYFTDLCNRYPDNVCLININEFKSNNNDINKYPLNLLSYIKTQFYSNKLIYVSYEPDISSFISAIKLPYITIVTDYYKNLIVFKDIDNVKYIQNTNEVEELLQDYEWYSKTIQKDEDVKVINNSEIAPINTPVKVKSLQDLIDTDTDMTDLDLHDVKMLQNKLKMGVLLQAKNMLRRVLKLTDILDKLYDELLTRIEDNIATTDTSSLMYTTDYISKALSDTNQFIVSLVNNEKIYNFFIFNESTIVNNSSDPFDVDKREKIRKATEIILNNYESIVDDKLDQVIDPNEQIQTDNNTGEKTVEK